MTVFCKPVATDKIHKNEGKKYVVLRYRATFPLLFLHVYVRMLGAKYGDVQTMDPYFVRAIHGLCVLYVSIFNIFLLLFII